MMAYDAARGQMLLFGGMRNNTKYLNDTWAWDGTTWEHLSPATFPPTRAWGGMAYDPIRQEVVLFGGWRPGHTFGDTWTWDGTNWTEWDPGSSG